MADLKDFANTASGNTFLFEEPNVAAGNVNDGVREFMAAVRRQHESAEWRDMGHTPTFVSGSTFRVSGDRTSTYLVNRPVRLSDTSTLYGVVTAVSYSAPDTSVTVSLDSGSMSVSLNAVAVGVTPSNASIPLQAVRGAGTVSNVGLAMPAEFSVASSPVTGSGTLTVTKANQTANQVYVGPASGGAAPPGFRALVSDDLPTASDTTQGAVELATKAEAEAANTALVAALNQLHNHPGVAKAWACFNGGSGSVLSSYGVTSVTRNSAGLYTVVLSRTMASGNYAIIALGSQATGSAIVVQVSRGTTPTSTGFQLQSFTTGNAANNIDSDLVYFSVFGTLA
jgi:hypothetical protein